MSSPKPDPLLLALERLGLLTGALEAILYAAREGAELERIEEMVEQALRRDQRLERRWQ